MVTSEITVDLENELEGRIRVWMEPNGLDLTIRFYTFDKSSQTWVAGNKALYKGALSRALIKALRNDRGLFSCVGSAKQWRLIDQKTGAHLIALAPQPERGSLRLRVPLPKQADWTPVFEELKQDNWVPAPAELQQAALEEALANTILRQYWEHAPQDPQV